MKIKTVGPYHSAVSQESRLLKRVCELPWLVHTGLGLTRFYAFEDGCLQV